MADKAVSENAVVIERTFEAPRDLVWQLWTDADHFKQWYGPHGFTIPVAEMDVKVGGKRLVCMEMHTPDGNTMQMWTTGEFLEVVPNERLVYSERPSDENGNIVESDFQPSNTTVTVVLEDLGGTTKMTMTHAGLPAEAQGAEGGWNQAFDKLAEHLNKVQS